MSKFNDRKGSVYMNNEDYEFLVSSLERTIRKLIEEKQELELIVSTLKEHIDDLEEDIKAWLDVSLKVYYLYQIGSVDIANSYSSNNSRKIYPYIINIESILDDLLSMYL